MVFGFKFPWSSQHTYCFEYTPNLSTIVLCSLVFPLKFMAVFRSDLLVIPISATKDLPLELD